MTPTIPTARLTLRPLRKPSPRNLSWLRDPDVVQFSEQRHREHTLSTQLRYVDSFKGRSHIWAIWHINDNDYIGNVSATVDEPNGVANMGIMIGETRYWGKGLASEAWKAACEHMLHAGGVRKLEAGAMRTNLAMIKIIHGSGFKQEGELLNHFMGKGGPVSALLFGRTR
jgi:RimJ/RimL family protein N-acetyltransferase